MLVLWGTYTLKPIKVIAIFVHEIGHLMMTFVFCGSIRAADLTLSEAGHTTVVTNEWFSTFMIASGGYIMGLVFSVVMLRVRNMKFRRYSLGLISMWVLISLVYVEKIPASFLYVIIFSVMTIVAYILNNDRVFEWIGDIIGVSSIAYCIYETFMKDMLPKVASKIDILRGFVGVSVARGDTEVLCNITGLPAVVWGTFWFVVSLMVMMFCMKGIAKSKKKINKEKLG